MTLTVFLVFCVVFYLFFLKPRNQIIEKQQQRLSELQENVDDLKSEKDENNIDETISEEAVTKQQEYFEKHIGSYAPDALSGQEIYIYKNFMKPWYEELVSKYRYDDKIINKIREDWYEYMDAVVDSNAYNFLFLETKEEVKSNEYRLKSRMAWEKQNAIESSFAYQIGNEAVDKLKYVRNRDSECFNRKGDMAPEGFIYDVSDELVPVTS